MNPNNPHPSDKEIEDVVNEVVEEFEDVVGLPDTATTRAHWPTVSHKVESMPAKPTR